MDKRRCSKCGETKPLSEFFKSKKSKDGYSGRCKICQCKYYKDNPHHSRAIATLRKHAARGIKIDTTINEVQKLFENATTCPICGVKFTHELGNGNHPSAPSLDRKTNDMTLCSNNIWIICHRCNRAKGELQMEEFYKYCETVLIHRENTHDRI